LRLDLQRDVDGAADGRRVGHLDLGLVDAVVGEAGERLLQRDARFESGEVGADAVVDAVAEGKVTVEVTRHVESIGSFVLSLRRA
jgi:hypothetical protein